MRLGGEAPGAGTRRIGGVNSGSRAFYNTTTFLDVLVECYDGARHFTAAPVRPLLCAYCHRTIAASAAKKESAGASYHPGLPRVECSPIFLLTART